VQQLGCDLMQGFLLAYPLAPQLIEETFFEARSPSA